MTEYEIIEGVTKVDWLSSKLSEKGLPPEEGESLEADALRRYDPFLETDFSRMSDPLYLRTLVERCMKGPYNTLIVHVTGIKKVKQDSKLPEFPDYLSPVDRISLK